MNKISVNSQKITMSSLEISSITGKEHSKVCEDIKRILNEAKIGYATFSDSYFSKQNKKLVCYNLPRRESDLVVSGYSVPYRLAIIDRWHELESTNKVPQTFIEALRALADKEEALLIEQGKVDKLNTMLDNEFGYSSILRAAQHIGISENNFLWRALKNQTIILGLEVKKVPSPRYAYQNLYPIRAFELAYPQYDFDDLTPENI